VADRSILYLDTIQKAVKNHPMCISLSEPRQPIRRELSSLQHKTVRPSISGRIWDMREGMEKRGWKSVKSPSPQVPLWVSEVKFEEQLDIMLGKLGAIHKSLVARKWVD